ncbi:MAG TPA: RbsD/FucU family protein [Fimbriimonadaceae bacterium]|nr:RbsD/FucU family protein [Fimbriimonadaceae bacterium]
MLKTPLLHPQILHALASAGHSSKILIADANYPFATVVAPNAENVYLNLSPGKLQVPEVFAAIWGAIPIESIAVNVPADGSESEVVGEIRQLAGPQVPLEKLGRFEFYDAVNTTDLCLVVATGEQRIYSCVLITIGYITEHGQVVNA